MRNVGQAGALSDTPNFAHVLPSPVRVTYVAHMPNLPLELIGTSEVAARLKRDTSTVHRLVNSGQLKPAAKAPGLRGAYLFAEDEIARFEREQAVTSREQVPA